MQGLIAILSEFLLIVYIIVLTVLAVRNMVKTRGGYVYEYLRCNYVTWSYPNTEHDVNYSVVSTLKLET